jgi:serine/threonine protein kinase
MDEEFSKRLLLLKDLTHSNILSYRGVYINDSEGTRAVDIVYLFPEGGTLHSLLFGRDIPLGWNFKLRLARGAATGVKHLHDNNVIHNDVRPYNFALDSESNCMLLDFHFAMQLHDVFCGEMLVGYGDPAYMSPECLNNDACCGSSDIFGLGLVMWELASQKQSSLVPRADDHTVNFERMRSLLPPSTPASFIELIRQCLLPERELRPAVEDIVEWLDSLMEEYTVDDDYPVPALPSLPFSAHTRASTDEGATRLNPLFGRNISSDEAHPASPESPGTRIPAPFASTGNSLILVSKKHETFLPLRSPKRRVLSKWTSTFTFRRTRRSSFYT